MKYTVVYTERIGPLTKGLTVVKMERLELQADETLQKALDRVGLGGEYSAWPNFIFEGWPKLEGNDEEEDAV